MPATVQEKNTVVRYYFFFVLNSVLRPLRFTASTPYAAKVKLNRRVSRRKTVKDRTESPRHPRATPKRTAVASGGGEGEGYGQQTCCCSSFGFSIKRRPVFVCFRYPRLKRNIVFRSVISTGRHNRILWSAITVDLKK